MRKRSFAVVWEEGQVERLRAMKMEGNCVDIFLEVSEHSRSGDAQYKVDMMQLPSARSKLPSFELTSHGKKTIATRPRLSRSIVGTLRRSDAHVRPTTWAGGDEPVGHWSTGWTPRGDVERPMIAWIAEAIKPLRALAEWRKLE